MKDRLTGALDVTFSEVRDFAQCPLKWFLHYSQNLAPRIAKPVLGVGSLAHIWLGWLHAPERMHKVPTLKSAMSALERAYEEAQEQRGVHDPKGEVFKTVTSIVERYLKWWERNNEGIKTVGTEITYHVPIFSRVPQTHLEGTLHGRIDWVFTKSSKLWVVDHKTVKRFSPQRYLYSMQGPIYALGVAKVLRRCPDFVGYNLIRRVAAKTIRPDVQMITVQTGPKELHLTEENLARWMRLMKRITFMDMAANHGADCSWKCNYLPICEALTHGLDSSGIIKNMFYVREHRVEGEDREEGS